MGLDTCEVASSGPIPGFSIPSPKFETGSASVSTSKWLGFSIPAASKNPQGILKIRSTRVRDLERMLTLELAAGLIDHLEAPGCEACSSIEESVFRLIY